MLTSFPQYEKSVSGVIVPFVILYISAGPGVLSQKAMKLTSSLVGAAINSSVLYSTQESRSFAELMYKATVHFAFLPPATGTVSAPMAITAQATIAYALIRLIRI